MIIVDEEVGVRILVDAVIYENTVAHVEVRDDSGTWAPLFKLRWEDLVEGRVSAATLGTHATDFGAMARAVAMAAARDARSRIAVEYSGGRA